LIPKFQLEGFDNDMPYVVTSWSDEEVNKLLKEWAKVGILGGHSKSSSEGACFTCIH
jgi:hypothetical protein